MAVRLQVSVVQFSNDVRVELSPQLMPMEQLRAQLGEMVATPLLPHLRWTFPIDQADTWQSLPAQPMMLSAGAKQRCALAYARACIAAPLFLHPDTCGSRRVRASHTCPLARHRLTCAHSLSSVA